MCGSLFVFSHDGYFLVSISGLHSLPAFLPVRAVGGGVCRRFTAVQGYTPPFSFERPTEKDDNRALCVLHFPGKGIFWGYRLRAGAVLQRHRLPCTAEAPPVGWLWRDDAARTTLSGCSITCWDLIVMPPA